MRLRQILLTFGALATAWIGLATHHGSPGSFGSPPARPVPSRQPAPDAKASVPKKHRARAHLRVRAKATVRSPARRRAVAPAPAPSRRSALRIVIKRAEPPFAARAVDAARPATAEPPAPPSPPTQPPTIVDAHIVALTSSTALIRWQTNVATRGRTAFGLDAPTIWTEPDDETALEHESVLAGLEAATTYQVYLHAVDSEQRAAAATLALTTGPLPETSAAHTAGDRIAVDDSPFYGRAVWKQCADGLASNLDNGINLFIGDGCTRDDRGLPHRLDGRAYSLLSAADAGTAGRGVIGFYYPDEWDAFLESTVRRRDLDDAIVAPLAGRISFLTLTNHFYSRAEPLPQGKGMYPLLFTIPDVIGFDLYPLQGWCRPSFADVFDAQRELGTASGGKPTFQWIEVAPMEQVCGTIGALDPTPASVRAETWLAIAGGADSVGYFPNRWSPSIGAEITRTNAQIKALTPALLAPQIDASSDNAAVRVSARALSGALYVIAVNTTATAVPTRISVDGIEGRSATIVGEDQEPAVAADARGFAASFDPLAAHVYVFPPQGW
jgi:hypothetical protein